MCNLLKWEMQLWLPMCLLRLAQNTLRNLISDAWYWLDSIDGEKKAVSKDVYQESYAGIIAG